MIFYCFSIRERTINLAEIKNMDAVAALDAMDAHVDDWRDATKGKQRGIFKFDDVASLLTMLLRLKSKILKREFTPILNPFLLGK